MPTCLSACLMMRSRVRLREIWGDIGEMYLMMRSRVCCGAKLAMEAWG